MSEIINLAAERAKRDEPYPEFISQDQWGRALYAFSVSYAYDSLTGPSRWTFTIWAYDYDDAERRLAAIKQGGYIDGQIIEEHDA